MEFVVYILYSVRCDQIYIGFTSDLISRIASHNKLANKGWTIKYRPWVVISVQFFDNKIDAMNMEKLLKGAQARKSIREKILTGYKCDGFISA